MKMKFIILLLLAFLAVAYASPLDKKSKNNAFGKCAKICQDEISKPLCASDGLKLTLSFLNECVLKRYNCEKNTILVKKSNGECPNGGAIRVS